MRVHQISVFLENRAGQLAEISRILADNGINMRAMSIAETADYGVLRIIADNEEKAARILREGGYILSMTPVVVVGVPDRSGGLAPLLQALAEQNLDIEYMYSLFIHRAETAYMVFRVRDEERFVELLAGVGITPATKEELKIC